MRLRYRVACIVAAIMGAALTVMRLVWTPADTVKSGLYAATQCVLVVALAALFFLCGAKRRSLTTAAGLPALLTAGASAWVGASLVIHALGDFLDFCKGVYPYPQPVTVTGLNRMVAMVMILGAALGGVFFLFTAVRWFINRRTDRASFGILALCPVVWTWARLLWYITSFASAVNRYRSVAETVLLLFEMLFLLAFARYASGVEEKTPRFVIPIALCTAMLGLVACFTRFGAYAAQDAVLFSGTALVVAPDLAIAVLAAVFAGQQMFATPLSEPESPEDADEAEGVEEEEQEAVAEFLLDVNALTSDPDDDDESALPDEERHPLELEDIINRMINGES